MECEKNKYFFNKLPVTQQGYNVQICKHLICSVGDLFASCTVDFSTQNNLTPMTYKTFYDIKPNFISTKLMGSFHIKMPLRLID